MVFTDRITNADVVKRPSEYQELLTRVLTIQADAELGGPNVYAARWQLQASTADAMYRVARIVAEEVDHYRKFAALLGDLGPDARYPLHRDNAERMLEAFRGKDPLTWGDVAAVCALVDRAGRFQLEEFVNASYLPWTRCCPASCRRKSAMCTLARSS